MGWLTLFLTIVMTMASIGDFLFGDAVTPAVRRVLYNMYFALEADWRKVYQVPAQVLGGAFEQALGRGSGSLRFGFSISLYSVFMTGMITIFVALSIVLSSSHFHFLPFVIYALKLIGITIIPNLLGDLLAWPVAIRILLAIAKRGPLFAVISTAFLLALAYVIAATILAIGFDILGAAFMLQDGASVLLTPTFYQALWNGLVVAEPMFLVTMLDILSFTRPAPQFLISLCQISVPGLLFITMCICSAVLFPARPLIKRPTLFLLERMEAYPKSLFVMVAGIASGLITMLAAWLNA